jgi:ACT domain-containing protein
MAEKDACITESKWKEHIVSDFQRYAKFAQSGQLTVSQAIRKLGTSRSTWYNLKTA